MDLTVHFHDIIIVISLHFHLWLYHVFLLRTSFGNRVNDAFKANFLFLSFISVFGEKWWELIFGIVAALLRGLGYLPFLPGDLSDLFLLFRLSCWFLFEILWLGGVSSRSLPVVFGDEGVDISLYFWLFDFSSGRLLEDILDAGELFLIEGKFFKIAKLSLLNLCIALLIGKCEQLFSSVSCNFIEVVFGVWLKIWIVLPQLIHLDWIYILILVKCSWRV